MTEPIHAILRHSVDVWMHDPVAFGFQQVGYISVGEANQIADYERVTKSQNSVGYPSEVFTGAEARNYLKRIWPDFKTDGVDVLLHEKVSGYAGTRQVMKGLAQKCADEGVEIISGVEVTDYVVQGGQVKAVVTNLGEIKCDMVIWGLGAWTPKHWEKLGQPMKLDLHYPDGTVRKDHDMWTYWRLLEGEVYYDQPYLTASGLNPVLHVELMNTPVVTKGRARTKDYLSTIKTATNEWIRPVCKVGHPVRLVGGRYRYMAMPATNIRRTIGLRAICVLRWVKRWRGLGASAPIRERRNGGVAHSRRIMFDFRLGTAERV
jgi:hypothetical protein